MKTVHGHIWIDRREDGLVQMGFTQQCIDEKLQETFHVVLADNFQATEKQPLFVLETCEGLESVPSPVSGNIMFFNDKARDFPDRIVEGDVILQISDGKKKKSNQAPVDLGPYFIYQQ